MSRLSIFLICALAFTCAPPGPEAPIVNLVTAEALMSVLPAAVDSFVTQSDTTYRGYRETETGATAQLTLARTYGTPGGSLMAINISSFDSREHFMAVYGEGAVRDSAASRETYNILFGRMVMVGEDRAVEAKSFDEATNRAALELIDYDAFMAFVAEPVPVDSSFSVVVN